MKPVRVDLAHRANYGVRRGKIEWIVMHYTANDGDSGMSNARYFQKALNPVASAHYFVDDREIVQSVPDEYVAYHCGAYKYRHPFCRNYNSIGIEMCDSKRDGTVKATEQTIRNAAELAAALCGQTGRFFTAFAGGQAVCDTRVNVTAEDTTVQLHLRDTDFQPLGAYNEDWQALLCTELQQAFSALTADDAADFFHLQFWHVNLCGPGSALPVPRLEILLE